MLRTEKRFYYDTKVRIIFSSMWQQKAIAKDRDAFKNHFLFDCNYLFL